MHPTSQEKTVFATQQGLFASTGERSSFLLYGVECRSATEAVNLPVKEVHPTNIGDFQEELMLSTLLGQRIGNKLYSEGPDQVV